MFSVFTHPTEIKMRKTLIAATLAIGTLITTTAQAALVTNWDWSVTSAWTGSTFTAADGINDGTIVTTANELSWGGTSAYTDTSAPFQTARSAVVITDSPAGSPPQMITNSLTPVPTNTFTHYNNTIDSNFRTLVTATLDTTLTLAPSGGGVIPPFPQTLHFAVHFIETLNQTPCFAGSITTCDDIFVITLGDLTQHFTYQDFTYQINIVSLLGGFLGLSDAACAAAGVSSGCVGFQTQEGQANVERLGLLISTVPEPGVLALMGLGLLGLAATRRRRTI
ncbi:MAG TPA: THxN family PEP-CTERM protein [Azonexus sp.]|nr:THxN family PEP-CTERM protein [Azonexus sp.]